MDNLNDLKAIWHSAKTDSLPTSVEMEQIIKKFRNQKLRNKWLTIVVSCLISVLMIVVLFIVPFKLLVTYLGGGLIATSSVLLAATNIKSLKRFYQLDDYSNLDFLAFIEQTRQNQIFYYKKTMVIIMLLCSVGLLLYLYELTYQHLFWFISTYAAILVYLLIMWFIVRPRSFKKGTEKLNATRQRLEKISNQLK
ncbi:hypothetical protein [Mucilaginibacter arboris]|uniref:Uncharacterized protein n=1 Tax=Mucilaginibacter arboris TaxID=2682090 RepID=A0A7K1SZW0_9SPHI|nr:hypothetical protein [Mucilaginibacter arboris]MVN22851.1 hypothetical protein [Mucilaginibacter arboris]